MKKNKNNENKHKKKLLIMLGVSTLTVLGSVLAYFTTTTDITNVFKTALYQHTVVEKFESPENWTPGTTTEKTVKITNTGSISMAVRASYTEKWVNKNGKEISLTDSKGNRASIINFNSSWTKDGNYYYFGSKANKTELKPNQSTTSFIESVTFNSDIESTLTKQISADGKTITFESSGNGYDNAKYILTVKIDTIQYDLANDIW